MDKPFTLTYNDRVKALELKFLEWVEETFVVAVKKWGDIL